MVVEPSTRRSGGPVTENAEILGLVDQIYAAAADPAHWQDTIDLFCAQYPEAQGTLLYHDVGLGSGLFAITSWGG